MHRAAACVKRSGSDMTKRDIGSGFLGAGKTTLIKKLIAEAYAGERLVLIENEFGEIGIDGGFLKEAGIEITEMNSGCICCSLVGDFREALKKVIDQYTPDRILIEPSGVGKLSDVTRAVASVAEEREVKLNCFATVADVNKVKLYMKNFGEFYNDQISHANAIILSRTGAASEEKVAAAVALIREKNPEATVVTTDWAALSGGQILAAMEQKQDFVAQLLAETEAEQHGHHHEHGEECCHEGHHHHEHGEECCHEGHHHHEHGEECCHEGHHHHEHGEECCHEGHHHHEHGEECCHEGHHHDHHHADEVFTSFGRETARQFTEAEVRGALAALDTGKYGTVLRAKGMLPGEGGWIYFDYVPGEADVRTGSPDVTGRLCVIGAKLDEGALAGLFQLA